MIKIEEQIASRRAHMDDRWKQIRRRNSAETELLKAKAESFGIDTTGAMKTKTPLASLKKLVLDYVSDGGDPLTETYADPRTPAPAAPATPAMTPAEALNQWNKLSRGPTQKAQQFLRQHRSLILAGHIESSENLTGSARAVAAFKKQQIVKA